MLLYLIAALGVTNCFYFSLDYVYELYLYTHISLIAEVLVGVEKTSWSFERHADLAGRFVIVPMASCIWRQTLALLLQCWALLVSEGHCPRDVI